MNKEDRAARIKTPVILYNAMRQYRHNTGGDELIRGFDRYETIKVVTYLEARIKDAVDLVADLRAIVEAKNRHGFDDEEIRRADDFLDGALKEQPK